MKILRRALRVAPIAVAPLLGCTHHYLYEPAAPAAVVGGHHAAAFAVPADAPRGEVRIAALGMEPGGPGGARWMHLRAAVVNASDRAWTVDTREQKASIGGASDVAPAYATSEGATPPMVEVPAGERREIDVFFAPAPGTDESSVASFGVTWATHVGDEVATHRVVFARIEMRPRPLDDDAEWGPPWRYDPLDPKGPYPGIGIRAPQPEE